MISFLITLFSSSQFLDGTVFYTLEYAYYLTSLKYNVTIYFDIRRLDNTVYDKFNSLKKIIHHRYKFNILQNISIHLVTDTSTIYSDYLFFVYDIVFTQDVLTLKVRNKKIFYFLPKELDKLLYVPETRLQLINNFSDRIIVDSIEMTLYKDIITQYFDKNKIFLHKYSLFLDIIKFSKRNVYDFYLINESQLIRNIQLLPLIKNVAKDKEIVLYGSGKIFDLKYIDNTSNNFFDLFKVYMYINNKYESRQRTLFECIACNKRFYIPPFINKFDPVIYKLEHKVNLNLSDNFNLEELL